MQNTRTERERETEGEREKLKYLEKGREINEGVYGGTNGDKGGREKSTNKQHREGEARQRRERQSSRGKQTEREKIRQKICIENEGRRGEVSSERGSRDEGGRFNKKKKNM